MDYESLMGERADLMLQERMRVLTHRAAEAEQALRNQEWQQPRQIKRASHKETPSVA